MQDFEAIDNAFLQFCSGKEVVQKCPGCGSAIQVEEYGNSYVVRCEKEGCIHVSFRGI